MESVQSILSTILKHVETLPFEEIPLLEAVGCIAGKDLVANADFPAATISMVKGFAARRNWIAKAPSSEIFSLPISMQGQGKRNPSGPAAIPIGLFEQLPKGFDVVLSSEEYEVRNGRLFIERVPEVWENVLPVGSRIRKGEVFLSKGTEISYSDVGTASFLGLSTLPVIRKPKVALIFICPSLKQVHHIGIFNKYLNGIANSIAAQVQKYRGTIKRYKILSDFSRTDKNTISRALKSDLILFVGECSRKGQGVLIQYLQKKGVHLHLQTENVYPGHFFSFGTIGEKLIFLLPNDPMGIILNFEEFIRPVIFKMRGKKRICHEEVNARLGKSLRNSEGNISLIQAFVQLKNGVFYATPLENGRDSGMRKMHSMNGIIVLPENVRQVPVGSVLRVQMLRQPEWNF